MSGIKPPKEVLNCPSSSHHASWSFFNMKFTIYSKNKFKTHSSVIYAFLLRFYFLSTSFPEGKMFRFTIYHASRKSIFLTEKIEKISPKLEDARIFPSASNKIIWTYFSMKKINSMSKYQHYIHEVGKGKFSLPCTYRLRHKLGN